MAGYIINVPLKFNTLIWSVLPVFYVEANKKAELMLMRCTRAYSSFCLQVILVCLHPFHRSSLSCSKKNGQNITKTPIFRVQGQLRSSMLTILRSSSPVLVMISSMSVLTCNHSHVRQANISKITTF